MASEDTISDRSKGRVKWFNNRAGYGFITVIDGDNIEINFTQGTGFETEISYTVKRWSM